MSEMLRQSDDRIGMPPQTGSAAIDTHGLPWQPTDTAGFWIRPLVEDARAGHKTWLMKIDAGAFAPLHDHAELEQIYVLDGSFYDQERSYAAGDFIVRAPGAPHTAGSREGALVLLVYLAA